MSLPDTDDGLVGLFLRHARTTPDRPFARFPQIALTYRDLERRSAAVGSKLIAEGIGPGDRVALMMRNSAAALTLMLAIARIGAVWVPVNAASRGDNLTYILRHCRPRMLIADEEFAATLEAAAAATLAARRLATTEVEAAAAADPAAALPERALPAPDTPFAIMYTSGTTGPAKGVIVSHRMLRWSGEGAALVADARPGDVLYVWEPLYHIGGAQLIVLPMIRGVALHVASRFSASRFWPDVQEAGASHIHFLGGILQMLLKQPPGPLDRAHGARIAWGGGCPAEIWRAFEERFGVEIRECYGMTECSSITTANLDGAVGSVGRPVPWLGVDILRPDGSPAGAGERGEIVVSERAPGVLTRGYLDDPLATARALAGDGRFRTGDLGSFDAAGRVLFHGRMSDSARVRGENVSAYEVESVAAKHPDVADCAFLAIASDAGEQEIKLLVELRPSASLTPAALAEWLAPRLASYQLPRYIAIVPGFERTPSLRIMKHRLSRATDDAWDRLAGRI